MIGNLRPGAHQTHLPKQNVEQLGQLVNAGFADEAAKYGFARVCRGAPAGFLPVIHTHTAEFQHFENLLIPAHPFLHKKHRARAAELHANGNRHHDRAEQQKRQRRTEYVHQTFQSGHHDVVQRAGAQIDQTAVSDDVYGRIHRNEAIICGNDADAHALFVGGIDNLLHQLLIVGVQSDDQLVHIPFPQNPPQILIGSQLFPQRRVGAVADIAVDAKTHLRILRNILRVLLSQISAAHNHDVFQVKSAAANKMEKNPLRQMLEYNKAAADQVEMKNSQPGYVNATDQVKNRRQRQCAYAVGEENRNDLAARPLVAFGGIDLQHIIENHYAQAVSGQNQNILSAEKVHVDRALHQIIANPAGEKPGQKGQERVAEQIQNIQPFLILFDHFSLMPLNFRIRNRVPFFSQCWFSIFTTGSSV